MARALSKMGYCSRSQAAELIQLGRVALNGRTLRDPERPVSVERDRISVDNRPIREREKVYLMMNKPRGIVTTASDEKGRDTVYKLLNQTRQSNETLVAKSLQWIAPVGRLDKASEGLLLLTNDSEWGGRVTAPNTHLEKMYHVQIARIADQTLIESLTRGVKAEDGEILRAKRLHALRAGQKNCWLEIILDEGKNRHIRRMLDALDVEVLRLVRVAIGPLLLGNLAKGAFRPLTTGEKQMLDHAMAGAAHE